MGDMTNNGHSNVIHVARFNLARLQGSTLVGKEPIKAMAARINEGDDDYRSRMFTSALVAGFVACS
jgi:hypothetical protein